MMNETCLDCKGSGEYVGFAATEPCKACDGTGVQDVVEVDYKSELTKIKGKEPCKARGPSPSAIRELNTWLSQWSDILGDDQMAWSQMSRDRVLGLRLPSKFIKRLCEELTNSSTGPARNQTRSEQMRWTHRGLTFQILAHAKEDWNPEIMIKMTRDQMNKIIGSPQSDTFHLPEASICKLCCHRVTENSMTSCSRCEGRLRDQEEMKERIAQRVQERRSI